MNSRDIPLDLIRRQELIHEFTQRMLSYKMRINLDKINYCWKKFDKKELVKVSNFPSILNKNELCLHTHGGDK